MRLDNITMEKDKKEKMASNQKHDRFLAVLAYLFLLLFIPLLRKKKSKFLAYHVNQGLVLFVLELCVGIVMAVVLLVLKFAAPALFVTVNMIFAAVNLLFLFCHIIGIFHVVRFEMKKIPIFGEIKLYHSDHPSQD